MTDPQPVQYDSAETAALEAKIAIRAKMQDINSWGGPYVGDDRGRVQGYGECLEILRDHLARVRAVPAPAATQNLEWITAISAERERQDSKWGGPEHDDHHSAEDWERFIMRRIPLASRLDKPFRKRMVEIGALAVAAIQSYDREHGGLKSAPAPSPADAPTAHISRAERGDFWCVTYKFGKRLLSVEWHDSGEVCVGTVKEDGTVKSVEAQSPADGAVGLLRELVACIELRDALDEKSRLANMSIDDPCRVNHTEWPEYARRKGVAWHAARAFLAARTEGGK